MKRFSFLNRTESTSSTIAMRPLTEIGRIHKKTLGDFEIAKFIVKDRLGKSSLSYEYLEDVEQLYKDLEEGSDSSASERFIEKYSHFVNKESNEPTLLKRVPIYFKDEKNELDYTTALTFFEKHFISIEVLARSPSAEDFRTAALRY